MAVFQIKEPSSRNGTTQTIAYTTTSASIASTFGKETFQIRIVADSAICYSVGDGAQTATSTSPFLPASWIEYVTVTPGQQVAVIAAPTNGLVTSTAGTAWITEIS